MTIDQLAAITGVAVLTIVSIFQLLLVFGAPLGFLVWGGKHKILPVNLRIYTLVYIVLNIIASFCLLERPGLIHVTGLDTFILVLIWIFAGIFSLSVFSNLLIKNKIEKAVMTPVAGIVMICCVIVAVGWK